METSTRSRARSPRPSEVDGGNAAICVLIDASSICRGRSGEGGARMSREEDVDVSTMPVPHSICLAVFRLFAALPKHQGMSWRFRLFDSRAGLSPKQLRRCMCVASRDSSSSGGGSGGSSRSSSTCPTVAEYDALWEAPLGSITGETMRKFAQNLHRLLGTSWYKNLRGGQPPRKGVIVETLLELLEESEWNLPNEDESSNGALHPLAAGTAAGARQAPSPASAMSSYSFFSGTDLPKAPSPRSRAPSYHEGSQTPSFSPTFLSHGQKDVKTILIFSPCPRGSLMSLDHALLSTSGDDGQGSVDQHTILSRAIQKLFHKRVEKLGVNMEWIDTADHACSAVTISAREQMGTLLEPLNGKVTHLSAYTCLPQLASPQSLRSLSCGSTDIIATGSFSRVAKRNLLFGIDDRKCMISIFSAESTPSNVGTTDTDMCAALDEEAVSLSRQSNTCKSEDTLHFVVGPSPPDSTARARSKSVENAKDIGLMACVPLSDPAVCDAKFAMAQSKRFIATAAHSSQTLTFASLMTTLYLRKCCAILDMGVASVGTMDLALLSPLSLHHGIITRIDSFSSSLRDLCAQSGGKRHVPNFHCQMSLGLSQDIPLGLLFSLSPTVGGASRRTREDEKLALHVPGIWGHKASISAPSSGPATTNVFLDLARQAAEEHSDRIMRATTLLKRIQSKSRHSDAGRSSSLQKADATASSIGDLSEVRLTPAAADNKSPASMNLEETVQQEYDKCLDTANSSEGTVRTFVGCILSRAVTTFASDVVAGKRFVRKFVIPSKGLSEKYSSVSANPASKTRDYQLQILLRLQLGTMTRKKMQQDSGCSPKIKDPMKNKKIGEIVSLLRQISFYMDKPGSPGLTLKEFLDEVILQLFRSTLPETVRKIYKTLLGCEPPRESVDGEQLDDALLDASESSSMLSPVQPVRRDAERERGRSLSSSLYEIKRKGGADNQRRLAGSIPMKMSASTYRKGKSISHASISIIGSSKSALKRSHSRIEGAMDVDDGGSDGLHRHDDNGDDDEDGLAVTKRPKLNHFSGGLHNMKHLFRPPSRLASRQRVDRPLRRSGSVRKITPRGGSRAGSDRGGSASRIRRAASLHRPQSSRRSALLAHDAGSSEDFVAATPSSRTDSSHVSASDDFGGSGVIEETPVKEIPASVQGSRGLSVAKNLARHLF